MLGSGNGNPRSSQLVIIPRENNNRVWGTGADARPSPLTRGPPMSPSHPVWHVACGWGLKSRNVSCILFPSWPRLVTSDTRCDGQTPRERLCAIRCVVLRTLLSTPGAEKAMLGSAGPVFWWPGGGQADQPGADCKEQSRGQGGSDKTGHHVCGALVKLLRVPEAGAGVCVTSCHQTQWHDCHTSRQNFYKFPSESDIIRAWPSPGSPGPSGSVPGLQVPLGGANDWSLEMLGTDPFGTNRYRHTNPCCLIHKDEYLPRVMIINASSSSPAVLGSMLSSPMSLCSDHHKYKYLI